jgi:hypothetical protein
MRRFYLNLLSVDIPLYIPSLHISWTGAEQSINLFKMEPQNKQGHVMQMEDLFNLISQATKTYEFMNLFFPYGVETEGNRYRGGTGSTVWKNQPIESEVEL